MKTEEFDDVFNAYSSRVYNYILRTVGDRTAAEDLTQEVFIKVYNGFDDLREKPKLATWIYRIATNACLDYFKSASYKNGKRTQPVEEREDRAVSYLEENRRVASIEERVIDKEIAETVRAFIDDLPEDYRTVIILHDLQGFKNREVAEILGVSLETVKIRLYRARRRLKSVLASFYDDYVNEGRSFDGGEE